MDVGKSTFLSDGKFTFLMENQVAIKRTVKPENVRDSDWGLAETKQHFRRIQRCRRKISKHGVNKGGFAQFTRLQDDVKLSKEALIQIWRNLSEEERLEHNPRRLPDSVDILFHPANTLGALPEKLLDSISSFIKTNDCGNEFESTLFWKGKRIFLIC
jgi:hypothetical protein